MIFNQILRVNLEESILAMQEAASEARRISESLEPLEGIDKITQLESSYFQNYIMLMLAAEYGKNQNLDLWIRDNRLDVS